jgi:hypothetical protein
MPRLTYDAVGMIEPEEGIIQFEILPEHLKLLRSLQLEWQGVMAWGSLQTNAKRPYGTPDFLMDVRKILSEGVLGDDVDSLTEQDILKLHRGAAMALQIALKTGKFKAGTFRSPKFGQDWHQYTPKKVKKNASESSEATEATD